MPHYDIKLYNPLIANSTLNIYYFRFNIFKKRTFKRLFEKKGTFSENIGECVCGGEGGEGRGGRGEGGGGGGREEGEGRGRRGRRERGEGCEGSGARQQNRGKSAFKLCDVLESPNDFRFKNEHNDLGEIDDQIIDYNSRISSVSEW